MAFTIDICKTLENNDKVDKSYEILASNILIDPTSDIDVLNPTFKIDYNSNYIGCNYVCAQFLGRSYFCTNLLKIGQQMQLQCTVDALSSWDLSNCSLTVLRNGGIGQPSIYPDKKLPVEPNQQTLQQTVATNSALTPNGERCYVLACIGGDIS